MEKRCAILFYGQPRLLTNFKQPLENLLFLLSSFSCDIYIHTWVPSSFHPLKASDRGKILSEDNNPSSSFDDTVIPFIKDFYKPTSIKIEEATFFDYKEYFFPLGSPFYEKTYVYDISDKYSNFISQYVSIEKVVNLISTEKRKQYDFYVLTRFDFFVDTKKEVFSSFSKSWFDSFLDTVIIPPSNKTIFSINDFFQIFNNNGLQIYKDIVNYTRNNNIFQKDDVSPELIRHYPFFKENFTFYGDLAFEKNHFKAIPISHFLSSIEIRSFIKEGCKLIRNKNLKEIDLQYIQSLFDHKGWCIDFCYSIKTAGLVFFSKKECYKVPFSSSFENNKIITIFLTADKKKFLILDSEDDDKIVNFFTI